MQQDQASSEDNDALVTNPPSPAAAEPSPALESVEEENDHQVEVLAAVTTLAEYAQAVTALAEKGTKIWFRGSSSRKHDLRPGLYRHQSIKESQQLLTLEWQLLLDYRHQAPPFVTALPADDLELLFLMQHYRVPTRLLDWTENPYIGLFFALENAHSEKAGKEVDAAVWILDPVALNSKALSTRLHSDKIFGAYSDQLNGYLPSKMPQEVTMSHPCALYGVHNSPRIVAQRGSFTLYGADVASMERQVALNAGEGGILKKIFVRGTSKKKIFDDLFNMGVSNSVVYPDLDGLSQEIRHRSGF